MRIALAGGGPWTSRGCAALCWSMSHRHADQDQHRMGSFSGAVDRGSALSADRCVDLGPGALACPGGAEGSGGCRPIRCWARSAVPTWALYCRPVNAGTCRWHAGCWASGGGAEALCGRADGGGFRHPGQCDRQSGCTTPCLPLPCTALAPRCWRGPSCMGPWRSTPSSWSSTCTPAMPCSPALC